MALDTNDPLVAEQVPINQAIAQQLVGFVPGSWQAAELRLAFGLDGGRVGQQVVNPDTGEGWTVSHELTMAVLDLEAHRQKFNLPWKSAVYAVRKSQAGHWQVSAKFQVPRSSDSQ